MKNFSLLFLFFVSFIFINSCSSSASSSNTIEYSFNESSFDVVEKKIMFADDLPKDFITPLNYWFNNKIKLTGFEGNLLILIKEYTERISDIPDGKKIEILMKFDISINQVDNKTKNISGEVKSYSEITGVYSLNDLDNLIKKTQYNLVVQFSDKLSK